jgi:hypothetical protein
MANAANAAKPAPAANANAAANKPANK